jgi:hypothetical protein
MSRRACARADEVKIIATTLRIASTPLLLALLALLAGCEQSGPLVYVLESPQTIVLTATASASKVQRGETVVLHVERRTTGKWKQIPRKELARGQCWVYRPPVEVEPEVARSIEWAVDPEGAVSFHNEYQLDQTRVATLSVKGKIKLTPLSGAVCEGDRGIAGQPIEIEVT